MSLKTCQLNNVSMCIVNLVLLEIAYLHLRKTLDKIIAL